MVDKLDSNDTVTFRVECNGTSCIGTKTFGSANESEMHRVDELGTKDAESSSKKIIIIRSRRFKFLQLAIRRIKMRRRNKSNKQKKSVVRESGNRSKQTREAQETTEQDEANLTFATQDLSIDANSDSPLLDEKPSTRQRKRFAGIWEDFEIARQIRAEQARTERGAKTNSLGRWEEFKENVEPSVTEQLSV